MLPAITVFDRCAGTGTVVFKTTHTSSACFLKDSQQSQLRTFGSYQAFTCQTADSKNTPEFSSTWAVWPSSQTWKYLQEVLIDGIYLSAPPREPCLLVARQ